MAELDDETLERVRRWCAEAGRQAGAAEIRAALAPLTWDELLHARALLADPPPARPLGPAALADLARGAPPDVAAEREREGRYRSETEELGAPASAAATTGAARPDRPAGRGRRSGPRRPSAPVIHRRRDRPTALEPPPPPAAPSFERLLDPPGRAVLERLLREHGARRSFVLRELAAWRTVRGGPPSDDDLTALLEHHGLTRAFAHRERDELLHALRAARGDRTAAAARVGLEPAAYDRALDRLGATGEAERIREERRRELRGRATISERCRLLASEVGHLADLGILEEVERDLRARLPEHLRALGAGGSKGSLATAFARSISLAPPDAVAVARRLGVDVGPLEPRTRRPASGAPRRGGRARGDPRASARPRGAGSGRPPRASAGGRPGARPARRSGGPPKPPRSRPRGPR